MNLRTRILYRSMCALTVGKGFCHCLSLPSSFSSVFSFLGSYEMHIWLLRVSWYHVFRYNALDALRLVSLEDEYFHCERCNGELVAESDKLVAQDVGDGDDNARRRRREKLKDMLQKMEVIFS